MTSSFKIFPSKDYRGCNLLVKPAWIRPKDGTNNPVSTLFQRPSTVPNVHRTSGERWNDAVNLLGWHQISSLSTSSLTALSENLFHGSLSSDYLIWQNSPLVEVKWSEALVLQIYYTMKPFLDSSLFWSLSPSSCFHGHQLTWTIILHVIPLSISSLFVVKLFRIQVGYGTVQWIKLISSVDYSKTSFQHWISFPMKLFRI